MLVSLAVIRLSVRVLGATFPDASLCASVERSISWLAWIAVVLWVTGVLPLILDAPGRHPLEVRRHPHCRLRNMLEGGLTAGLVLVLALWISAAPSRRSCCAAVGNDLVDPQDGGQPSCARLLLFVGLLFALSAAGIDLTALSRAGRRSRRRPGLRAAEARGQLHQRLRRPGRAVAAHRRHGQGGRLRRPHHRHQAPATP